jgi:L-alanine-DL-glutamate epimerase-like enolase superfamily enzyme
MRVVNFSALTAGTAVEGCRIATVECHATKYRNMSERPAQALPAACGQKITAVTIGHHRLPLAPPFNASWDSQARVHFDATIVRVTTDGGLTGVAFGDRMLGFEGHESLFVGEDPLAIERHYRVLSNIDFHYGRCWPLDLALWDLAGKILAAPGWKLLGGLADRVRAYASSGTLREPAAQADAAERYLAQGFPALKLRFHRGDWGDVVRALEAVRARVGNRLELLIDCNQGWRLPWTRRRRGPSRTHSRWRASSSA